MVRKNWLIKGDRNTRYFYIKINIKRKNNVVYKIRNQDGVWIEEED